MVVGAGTGPLHLPSVLDLYAHPLQVFFSREGPARHSSKVDVRRLRACRVRTLKIDFLIDFLIDSSIDFVIDFL